MKKIIHTLMLCLGLVASTCMALSCMSENNTTINNEYCSISNDKKQLSDPTKVESEFRTTKTFSTLASAQGIEVVFTPNNVQKAELKVTATKNFLKYLQTEVKDGELSITWDTKALKRDFKKKQQSLAARVEISAPVPSEVKGTSASVIRFTSATVLPAEFEVDMSSAASFIAEKLSGKHIEVDASSAGSFKAKEVHVANFKADASSASSITTEALEATEKAELDASSSSSIKVAFTEDTNAVEAEASSAADIKLSGTIRGEAKLEASSGASVKASNLKPAYSKLRATSGGEIKAPQGKRLSTSTNSGGEIR